MMSGDCHSKRYELRLDKYTEEKLIPSVNFCKGLANYLRNNIFMAPSEAAKVANSEIFRPLKIKTQAKETLWRGSLHPSLNDSLANR